MIHRIKEVSSLKERSVRAFARRIGFPYTTLNNYITGNRTTIDSQLLSKIISTYNDISANWLLIGEGEMLKHQSLSNVNVSGEGNKIQSGNINIMGEQQEKEIEHLNALLREKERILEEKERVLEEKERTINILLNQHK